MKTEFTNIMHRADMPKKFAGAPWNYLEILLDKNHANIATFSENLTALLRKTNREAEAREMEERARGIRESGNDK